MSILRKQQVLLFAVVFAVFYVTVFGDLCVVDDRGNMMEFWQAGGATLKELFLPRAAAGGYYRPLVGLSYLLDLRLWDLDTRMLHLDNVLLHCVNALMVYLLAFTLLPREKRQDSLIPLTAGLIFGLHPISTESVNWISGRTDLIAGFFVLLSSILLVCYYRSRRRLLLACAALSVLVGMLGKEVALGFIPGALLLAVPLRRGSDRGEGKGASFHDLLWLLGLLGVSLVLEVLFFNFWAVLVTVPVYGIVLYRSDKGEQRSEASTAHSLRPVLLGVGAVLLAIGIGFAVRRIAFTSDIPKIPQTVKLMLQDPNHTFSVFLGSAAFYSKKFLFPYPLNFGIREIEPLYALLGTLLLFLWVHFAARSSVPRALTLAGAFLFVPALPLAFGTVAWTAYAERYVYIPSAFWSVALALWLGPLLAPRKKEATVAVTLLLAAAAALTVQRNLVWGDSLVLMKDTVEKSPRFREARGMYMAELLRVGDLKGAEEQYRIATSLPSTRYDERLDANMARVFLNQGKKQEALAMYRQIYRCTKGRCSEDTRRQLHRLVREEIDQAPPGERDRLQKELLLYPLPRSRKGPSPLSAGG